MHFHFELPVIQHFHLTHLQKRSRHTFKQKFLGAIGQQQHTNWHCKRTLVKLSVVYWIIEIWLGINFVWDVSIRTVRQLLVWQREAFEIAILRGRCRPSTCRASKECFKICNVDKATETQVILLVTITGSSANCIRNNKPYQCQQLHNPVVGIGSDLNCTQSNRHTPLW